jgi:dTDP-4-dehydrorhamnose reductase
LTPRILVTGAGGQLGKAVVRSSVNDIEIVGVSRHDCNIEDPEAVAVAINRYRPTAIVNAAAYTNVDKAESEPDRAFGINRDGVRNLARAAANYRARLVHVSTDYVFDGASRTPYPTTAKTNPLSVYGASKLAGEEAVLASHEDSVVVRSAWIFSSEGSNFVPTVLRKLEAGEDLRFVADQTGTPTAAPDLAQVLVRLALDSDVRGIMHWTNAGSGSRYDEAVALQEIALKQNAINQPVKITAIKTGEFPAAAQRPLYSVLDSTFLWERYGTPDDWRVALERTFTDLLARRSTTAA